MKGRRDDGLLGMMDDKVEADYSIRVGGCWRGRVQCAAGPLSGRKRPAMTHEHDEHHDHEHDHHHHHPRAPGEFTAAKPILNVANAAASMAYYVEKLGFELVFAWCDEAASANPMAPTFGEVQRGQAAIMLAQGEQGGPGMWIYLDMQSAAELEAVHAEYVRRGALIAELPEDKPWGMREMLVRDLDGHVLRMGGPLEHG